MSKVTPVSDIKLLAKLNAIMGSRIDCIDEAIATAEGCVEEAFVKEKTEEFLGNLAAFWPSYMAYHDEQERNAQ